MTISLVVGCTMTFDDLYHFQNSLAIVLCINSLVGRSRDDDGGRVSDKIELGW